MDPRLKEASTTRHLGGAVDPLILRFIDEVLYARQGRSPASWQALADEAMKEYKLDVTAEELEAFITAWSRR